MVGDVTIVAGLFGHGTSYYTHLLNHMAGATVAQHEWIYGRNYDPAIGQLFEVSAWSFPHEPDYLLVRDPRKALWSLKRHNPYYHDHTHKHLGYHPHTMTLLQKSWVDWYRIGLRSAKGVIRLEDLPVLDLPRNSTSRGRRRPIEWMDLSAPVRELAMELGYHG